MPRRSESHPIVEMPEPSLSAEELLWLHAQMQALIAQEPPQPEAFESVCPFPE
jgi:hypothetical protein